MANKICITTDCVCDLSDSILKRNNVDLVYFYIKTDTGVFRDVSEITAQNVFEYISNGGGKTTTTAPPPEEYVEFFKKKLRDYDEVIHINISSGVSLAYANAMVAFERLNEDEAARVHIVDSLHLSTGIAHLVLRAAEMVRANRNSEEILAELDVLKTKVSSSFMADNADYLYINGKVGKNVQFICSKFNIHPVLMMKDGKLVLKTVQIGKYEKSAIRYVRNELKKYDEIKRDLIFVTHAGCKLSDIRLVKREISRIAKFDAVEVTKASATVSGNSGPRTFGLLFVKE